MSSGHRVPLGEHAVNSAPKERAEKGEKAPATKRSIADLRRDLDRAQARIARKDVARSMAEPNDSLEVKLHDLVRKHQSSKAKYQTEIDSLKAEKKEINEVMEASKAEAKILRDIADSAEANLASTQATLTCTQAELSSALTSLASTQADLASAKHDLESTQRALVSTQANLATTQGSLASVESSLATTQGDNIRLHAELDSLRQSLKNTSSSEHADHKAERAGWVSERQSLQRELELLKMENERMVAREAQVEVLEAEHEHLEETVEIATREYARRYMTSVDKGLYEALKHEAEDLRMDVRDKEEEERLLLLELGYALEEVDLLKERIEIEIETRQTVEEMFDSLLGERQVDWDVKHEHSVEETEESLDSASFNDELAQVEARHSALAEIAAQVELRDALVAHSDLLNYSAKIGTTLETTKKDLHNIQRTYAGLESRHLALDNTHSACEPAMAGLRDEVSRWQCEEQRLSKELATARADIGQLEDKSKRERDALRRANDTVMRSKAAEEALEDEINLLREAFEDAHKYEDMYNSLLDTHRELVERENLITEEAERLGAQNAELIGHGNGDQKISYVESVRREMALSRHELASTRHMLNRANDRVRALTEEVESYKSIGHDLGMNASTRTRVTRRVPEGTWVSKGRTSSRSVSNPGR